VGPRIRLDPSENGNNISPCPGIEHTYLTVRSLVTVLAELTPHPVPKTYILH